MNPLEADIDNPYGARYNSKGSMAPLSQSTDNNEYL